MADQRRFLPALLAAGTAAAAAETAQPGLRRVGRKEGKRSGKIRPEPILHSITQ